MNIFIVTLKLTLGIKKKKKYNCRKKYIFCYNYTAKILKKKIRPLFFLKTDR